MIIENFHHFGGKHAETAALKNVLAFNGVKAPHTGKPFSEALCFGIAGGIAAGYGFCPSVPRHGTGSGVSVLGRYGCYVTNGSYHLHFFQRIGMEACFKETGGLKAAYKHLKHYLEMGQPVIVWCDPQKLSYSKHANACDMSTMVVYGVDEATDCAYISDRSPRSLTLSLEDLTWSRHKVCSHKNRAMIAQPGRPIGPLELKRAVLEGIDDCVTDLLQPRMKAANLPGLLEWSKMLISKGNKKGWPRVFSDGTLYLALRSIYTSIETVGTGGSLFRCMYADFLDEVALITNDQRFGECAQTYRALGVQWSQLAQTALPDHIPAFKKTVELLDRELKTLDDAGEMNEIDRINEQLESLKKETKEHFPLNEDQAMNLLGQLSAMVKDLHRRETYAAQDLKRVRTS